MKRSILLLAAALLLLSLPVSAAEPSREEAVTVEVPSAILMERSTGTVLYEKDADKRLAPASVTKVMTMLLVVEAVENGQTTLEDSVTASARAAGMGGSQIWLEEGETMSVSEMLKCVAVVSANDCCVALAEHLCGTEEAFVVKMNERAAQLGMKNTHFVSCSGLSDSDDHYSTARDIAIMSRELLRHPLIKEYTTVWMDTIRDGAFGLSNTNKLIYYYPGATGLKTGFTSKAMYCLSASAERDGVEYIAVVLHGATSADRFESAKTLLSYAFANYTLVVPQTQVVLPPVEVRLGVADSIVPQFSGESGLVLPRTSAAKLDYVLALPETIAAPVLSGQTLGKVEVYNGQTLVQILPVVAGEGVDRLSLWQMFFRIMSELVQG